MDVYSFIYSSVSAPAVSAYLFTALCTQNCYEITAEMAADMHTGGKNRGAFTPLRSPVVSQNCTKFDKANAMFF